MEIEKAREVIRALAYGYDRATGESCPPGSPYQQADTVRAFFVALEALERIGRSRADRPIDPNRQKVGSITARLMKLGLIEDNPMNRAGQGNWRLERSVFHGPQSDAPAPAGGSNPDPFSI